MEKKRVSILKKQNSKWDITTTHKFTHRFYEVDNEGNFYRNGKISEAKPDKSLSKVYMLIDDDGNKLRFKLHQIIAQTFLPLKIKSGESVDHIDRNRLNNNVKNLRFATREQQYSNRDNKSHKYKKVICINNNAEYESCKHAEIDLNLVTNTVSRVARGQRKSIRGYRFKFV